MQFAFLPRPSVTDGDRDTTGVAARRYSQRRRLNQRDRCQLIGGSDDDSSTRVDTSSHGIGDRGDLFDFDDVGRGRTGTRNRGTNAARRRCSAGRQDSGRDGAGGVRTHVHITVAFDLAAVDDSHHSCGTVGAIGHWVIGIRRRIAEPVVGGRKTETRRDPGRSTSHGNRRRKDRSGDICLIGR